MTTRDELKSLLLRVKDDQYAVPGGADAYAIAMDMTAFIGDTGADLRDELIYTTFYKWCLGGVFSDEQLKRLLYTCMDERHLFSGIGERDTDTVFTRTFSVLIIPLVFYADRQRAFLTQDDVMTVKRRTLDYITRERDFRGYVAGKGWAHALAHTADALDDIALSPFMGRADLLELLSTIKAMVSIGHCVAVCDEEERIAAAFMSVYGRGALTDGDVMDWLDSFRAVGKTGAVPFDLYVRINNRHFLQSAYFRLLKKPDAAALTERIADVLEKAYT